MQPIERDGYSREEILSVLHAERNSRNVRFRYDLLDNDGRFKRTLANVVSGEVSMSALSTIKRTAKFKVKEVVLPSYITREGAQKTWSSFSGWTHTNTFPEGTYIRADNMVASSAPSWDMEGYGNYESGVANGWIEWNGANGTASESTGGLLGKAQNMNKTSTSAVTYGIVTNLKNHLPASAGDKLYLSFFYKKVSTVQDPNYVYAMSNDGAGNISFSTNATYTDLGNGWWRFDSWVDVPRSTSWGILLAVSTANTGTLRVDNLWFARNVTPDWTGEAQSPVIDVSDSTSLGLGQPQVVSSTVTWSKTGGSYNSSETGLPKNNLQSRYSLNGGSTWSSWVDQPSGVALVGLPLQANMSNLRVQFRWQYERYIHTDSQRLTGINLQIDYERDVQIPESTEINYLSDRIQPFMEVQMPDKNWVSFPLGVFLLSSPTRVDENGLIYRDIEAYDGLLILDEDKFTSRYNIPSGTKYTDAVETILRSAGITQISIEGKDDTLGTSMEFAIGTSKLEAVNTLLQSINYTSLWVDANGYFTASPYASPTTRGTDYRYEDNELSVTYNGMEEELDVFGVANVWVLTESNPEKTPKVARKINNNPDSPTSTVNLGRNIVDFREIEDVSSQSSLNALANRIAFEASQVYGKLKFKTALMPFHEYSDLLHVVYSPLNIDYKFVETDWTMKLEAGGEMEHEARRVVNIDES